MPVPPMATYSFILQKIQAKQQALHLNSQGWLFFGGVANGEFAILMTIPYQLARQVDEKNTACLLQNPFSTNPMTSRLSISLYKYNMYTCTVPCSFPTTWENLRVCQAKWLVYLRQDLFIIVHLHLRGYHGMVVPGHDYHKTQHFYARVPLWLGLVSTAYNLEPQLDSLLQWDEITDFANSDCCMTSQ